MILAGVTNLTGIDLIILLVLAIGFMFGCIKGVIRQAFSLGGLIAGLILGSVLSKPVALFLLNSIRMSEKTASVVAFILILIVVPLIFTLLGELLSKIIRAAKLGALDRFAGGIFGMLKFTIFLGLAIQLLEYTGLSDKLINKDEERQSRFYEPVRKTTDTCLKWAWKHVMEEKELIENLEKECDD